MIVVGLPAGRPRGNLENGAPVADVVELLPAGSGPLSPTPVPLPDFTRREENPRGSLPETYAGSPHVGASARGCSGGVYRADITSGDWDSP